MATTSDSSLPPPHNSGPPSPIGNISVSPLSSPWVHIVRGTESMSANAASVILPDQVADVKPLSGDIDVIEVQSLENSGGSNGEKKPVWNMISPLASPVMEADSWPALSESAKASTKLSSFASRKLVMDGLSSNSQGTRMFSPSSHSQVNKNVSPSSNPNHVAPPTRQRTNHRGKGGGSSVNARYNKKSNGEAPPPQGLAGELDLNNGGKSPQSTGEPSAKKNMHREGGGRRRESGSQSQSGGENQQWNSYRRGSSGPHLRDGFQHNNHGGRHDQDRGNQDWNPHRNFGSRDAPMQSQRGSSRPFFRGPSPANTTFLAPPPIAVHPFVTPMPYPGPEVPSPIFYPPGPHLGPFRPVPLAAPIGPVYFPFGDPHLHMKIINQIEYYFSNDNLVKDMYLRQNMDEQGWVPIKLIAGFNLVCQLTDDIQQILAALQSSIFLEVEGEKVRRRDDWATWTIPHSSQHSTSSPKSTSESCIGILAENLQCLSTNDNGIPSRSSSGDFSSHYG